MKGVPVDMCEWYEKNMLIWNDKTGTVCEHDTKSFPLQEWL